MPVPLPSISLAAAVVGTTGNIPFGGSPSGILPPPTIAQQMRPNEYPWAGSLIVFNESGCELTVTFPISNQGRRIPAGGWRKIPIPPGETQLNYQVIAILPNQPVALLLADLFMPGEPLDDIGSLGNSPIGVTGVINLAFPTLVTQTINQHVTSTAQAAILSVQAPATGLYRISWSVLVNNGTNNNNVTLQATWVDGNLAGTQISNAVANTSGGTTIALAGAISIPNASYAPHTITIYAAGGANIRVLYTDPTNTPSDFVSAWLERLA